MKKKKGFLFLLISLIIILSCSKNSFSLISSQIYEEIKKDFTQFPALIIGIEDYKIIIDAGRAQGIKPKDIFTVYKKEKKIVHPETGKTLGFLKEEIGKIEITEVEENFAIGRVIFQKEPFPVPSSIERFKDLKILIVSNEQNFDENLLLVLKNNLPDCTVIFDPNIKFKDLTPQYIVSQKYDLVFLLEEDAVKVFDYKMDLIRYYGSLSYKKPTTPTTAEIKTYKPYEPHTLSISPPNILGKMKGEVFQTEFTDIDGDNIPEMIYFNSQGLFVVKIKGGLLAQYTPKNGKIVNFSTGPSSWIALNIFDEDAKVMRSEILKYTEQGLTPVITNVNLILNFVDYTGTGIKDTLIGQVFDPENFFGKEVYILKRENNQLIYSVQLNTPLDYKNIGSAFVDLDGDGTPEILNYLSDGRLGIYKESKEVWISPYPIAKHFYEVKLVKGKKEQEVIKRIIYPFITPVSVDINRDGRFDILFVSSEFPLEQVRGDLRSIPLNSATSQIFMLSFEGTYFFRNLFPSQTGFITGLGVFENNIYYTLVKGNYPGGAETELYSALF